MLGSPGGPDIFDASGELQSRLWSRRQASGVFFNPHRSSTTPLFGLRL